MEEKQLYGNLTVYRERGRYLRRLEQFEKAQDAYDTAFKTNPEDVRLLIGRSQVGADAVRPVQAYNDAELALKLEPLNMQARNMQARAMYTLCDFERSVVMNYRGLQVRRQPPYFKEGISQGIETLEDSIGVNAGNMMLDFLPIIRQNEVELVDEHEPEARVHVSRIPRPEKKRKMTQLEARRTLTLTRVLAMKYLGPLANDKFFLQQLAEDRRLNSANAAGSRQLKALIAEALRSLSERQEMLRAQRPYYSIKLAEKAESKYQNKFRKDMIEREREFNASTVEYLFRQLDKCLKEKRIMDLIKRAERMQMFLDMKSPKTLPDKSAYMDRLYRAVGEGYLQQYRLSYRLSERGNRRRVAFLMGLPTGRPKSFDSVMANFPHNFIDSKIAMERVVNILDMCENNTQRCYLMYELARNLNQQRNYSLAKFYGRRCQKQAKAINSATWWLNGCCTLISGDMLQNNANDVRVHVEEAYEYSKLTSNPGQVQSFLEKCAEMAAQAVAPDERRMVVQRERQVLAVMEEPYRVETAVLFKRMGTVPVGRRFSVLPRKLKAGPDVSERKRRKQRGLTIVPGQVKALPPMPRAAVLGHQVFDI